MNTSAQAAAIARWAESRSPSEGSKAMSRIEKSQIVLASKRTGMTTDALAKEFGRTEAEIAEVLRTWVDSRDVAKHLLTVQAAELTDRMIADADPGIALDILERVDVVRPKKGGDDSGKVTVILNGFDLHGLGVPSIDGVITCEVPDVPAIEAPRE
jgi:hypothetical protein